MVKTSLTTSSRSFRSFASFVVHIRNCDKTRSGVPR